MAKILIFGGADKIGSCVLDDLQEKARTNFIRWEWLA